MTDNRWKYAATRGELLFWLVISLLGLCMMIAVLVKRGIPSGPALFEVVALPSVFLGYLLIRSVKRLIRREHP
jgi:xanthosine utilization system XapX-like protein